MSPAEGNGERRPGFGRRTVNGPRPVQRTRGSGDLLSRLAEWNYRFAGWIVGGLNSSGRFQAGAPQHPVAELGAGRCAPSASGGVGHGGGSGGRGGSRCAVP